MTTTAKFAAVALEAGAVVANLAYWWWVVTRGAKRWQARVERRYRVEIKLAGRGTWKVVSDHHGWFARLGIEMLQLVWFMGAMLVWGLAIGGTLALFALSGLFDHS